MNGFHLDLKWSMPTKPYLQSILDTAKTFGFDTILLEFEDKLFINWLKSEVNPQCWSKADLKCFLELADEKGFEVIPKIPLMGHMEWILQWPKWSHLQENNDRREMCPSHPESKEFASRLLDSVLKLFPKSKIIHLGGDETESLGTCHKCVASDKSKSDLYLNHYLPLINQAQNAGKKVMLYCDMLLAHPEALKKIPKSVIICDWDYWSGTGDERVYWGIARGVRKIKQLPILKGEFAEMRDYFVRNGKLTDFPYLDYLQDKGFEVVALSAARCFGDNYCAGRPLYHTKNVLCCTGRARQSGLQGVIVTSWAARFNHFETTWPILAASSWSYQRNDYDVRKVSRGFAKEFFGCDWDTCLEDMDMLSPVLPDLHAEFAKPYPPGIVHNYIKYLYTNPESKDCKQVQTKLPMIVDSYNKGEKALNSVASKIRKNQYSFKVWQLAVETLTHKAQVLPIIINISQGKLVNRRVVRRFYERAVDLAMRHSKLFAMSYKKLSCKMEVDIRFAEELAILREKM